MLVVDPTTSGKLRYAEERVRVMRRALECVPLPRAEDGPGAYVGRVFWWLRKVRDEALRA